MEEENIVRGRSSSGKRGGQRYIYTPPSPSPTPTPSASSSNQHFYPPTSNHNQYPISINQNFLYPPPPLPNNYYYSTPPSPMLMPNYYYNQQQQQQQQQPFPSHYLQFQRQNPHPLHYGCGDAATTTTQGAAGIHTTTSNPPPPDYVNQSHYHHHHHHYLHDDRDRLHPNTKTINNNPLSSSSAKQEEEELCTSILKQIEYYFSDENLIHDGYLRDKMDQKEGWVDIHLIATFRMIRSKTDDVKLILHALQPSQTVEIQGEKMRRRHTWNRWIPTPTSSA